MPPGDTEVRDLERNATVIVPQLSVVKETSDQERNATGRFLTGTYIMSLGPVPNSVCVPDHARVRSPARGPVTKLYQTTENTKMCDVITELHNKNTKMLLPVRRRAILPHDCDQRHGREEYPSDVSDTDDESDFH